MIQIKIEDKRNALQSLANYLSDKNLKIANTRAINVAIRKANTQYRKLIVSEYNIKYVDTKNISTAAFATYSKQEGTISGTIKPISISRFNPTFKQLGRTLTIRTSKNKSSGKRSLSQMARKASHRDADGGVAFEIKKGEKKVIPFAFMVDAAKPGISLQVWARGEYSGNKFQTNKKRLPITALKTVSPFGAMTNPSIQIKTERQAGADLQHEFERQVNFLLKQAGGK